MSHCRIIAFFIALTILAQPSMLLAQSTSVRQRFDPNVTVQSQGNTFSGLQFSGVGGAIAGCMNAGRSIINAAGSIGNLFASNRPTVANTPAPRLGNNGSSVTATGAPGGTRDLSVNGLGQSAGFALSAVPTSDDAAKKELEKVNQREQCLNGVAYAVAKSLLSQITNKTLSWVNTGFGGNPFYVRDINSYLRSVSDEQTRLFLERIPNQNPVFGNAIRSIVTQNMSGIRDGFLERTMDTPEGRAYQAFQNDFIIGGGWGAFLNPNNSPIVAIFDAADDLSSNISTQQQNIRDELQRNNGFLDMRKCVEYVKAVIDTSNTSSLTINQEPRCLRWETVTPGSVIAAQVSEVTTSSIRQLEQADQINEVLGSFFDQLLNNFYSGGLLSTRGRSGNGTNFGGPGSNVVIGSNGQPLASIAGGGMLGYRSLSGGAVVNDFDISRPQQIQAVLQAQYDYLNRVRDARAALLEIAPLVGALDYCIPGPNPTWADGLGDNTTTYFSSLQELQKNSTVFSRLLQSLPIIGSLFSGGSTHAVAAADVQLYDKVSGGPVPILDTVYRIKDHTIPFVFNNVQWRYEELINLFRANYTKDAIKNAFAAVDSDQTFARAFVDDAFTETSYLASYGQNTPQINAYYTNEEVQTQDAIQKLEAIRQEAIAIVTTAKARYIAEQAAAGTPVNMACINDAYSINSNPITPVARQMSDTPSTFYTTSAEAGTYFYSNL
jgi:hypothetical protein